jgi:hypothetical protein
MIVPQVDALKIVESFWADVWVARDPEAVDHYVVEDVVITSGGMDIHTKDAFKQWVRDFLSKIVDFEFETIESFQNADGSRVASRWRVRGRNNGMFGLSVTDDRSSLRGRRSERCVPTAN